MQVTSSIWILVVVQIRYAPGLNYDSYVKPNACNSGTTMFVCDPTSPTSTCVSTDKYMDCNVDCPNAKDEECKDGFIKCDKCKCVTAASYKKTCMDVNVACVIANTTACKSADQCVLNNWLMDGDFDCNDKSDEDPCFLKLPSCPTTPAPTTPTTTTTTTPTTTTTTPTTTTTTTTPTTTTTTATPTTTTTTTTPTTTTTTPTTTTTTPTTTTTTTTPTTTPTTTTTTTPTTTTTTTTPTTTTTTTTPTTTTTSTTTTTTTPTTPVPITFPQSLIDTMSQLSSLKPASCSECNCESSPSPCSAKTINALPFMSKCSTYYRGVIFGMFQCKNGIGCVYYKFAMDGVKDCQDGSDENPLYWNECLLERHPCDKKNGKCIDDVVKPPTPDGSCVCECIFGYGSKDNAHYCEPLGQKRRRRRFVPLIGMD